MSAKKDEERKPDLHEDENQQDAEKHVKEIMGEPDEAMPQSKDVPENTDKEETTGAPELPKKSSISITVVDHTDTEANADTDTQEDTETSETEVEASEDVSDAEDESTETTEPEDTEGDPELAAAIEEANEQLSSEASESEGSETTSTDTKEESEESAPIETEDSEEKASDSEAEEDEEPLDDETNKAVDDIIKQDSDKLLKTEDEKVTQAAAPKPKPSLSVRLKSVLTSKAFRRSFVATILIAVVAVAVVPTSRYFTLNAMGVRSGASLTVLDNSTRQPLRNVNVSLAGQTVKTDADGLVEFRDIKLGRTQLTIEKRAFASIDQPMTLGWGSNPLGEYRLDPTGSQYEFVVKDYLTGEPIHKIEAVSGESSAYSDENGIIKLTIEQTEDSERQVVLQGDGYRSESLTLNLDSTESIAVTMVSGRSQPFISKRTGTFDVYKVDIDGKNEELIFPGTGSERDDMVLTSHPTEEIAALVSTRENKRNEDGFLLSTLTLINLEEDTAKEVAISERIQIVDWIGSRLVYVQVADGASASNPNRHRLMSYDFAEEDNRELAASNYFNDVLVAGGKIYYAPSSAYTGNLNSKLFVVDADGSNQHELLDKEVWNMFRLSYDRLALSYQQDWYEHTIGETELPAIINEPANLTSRVYVNSPDNSRSLWIDNRDGKGVLLVHNVEDNEDSVLLDRSGLKYPVRWLNNDTIVFRVSTDQETADYALSLSGGEARKITDVTDTGGINQWYYY